MTVAGSTRVLGSYRPKTAMFVGAHPDDIDYYAGGLVWNLASMGWTVLSIVLTKGEKGTANATIAPRVLARDRVTEQRESLRLLGCNVVLFGKFIDGEVSLEAAREFLTWHVRKAKPEILISFDPWRQYETHPDHRNCGFATVESRRLARHPGFYPKQLQGAIKPVGVRKLMLFKPQVANHHEELTDIALRKKTEAVLFHRSQFGPGAREEVRARAMEDGKKCGLRYSEPFHVIE